MAKSDDYAQAVLDEAMKMATAGLDLDQIGLAMQAAVEALRKQCEELRDMNLKEQEFKTDCPKCDKRIKVTVPAPDLATLSRAVSHVGKLLDDGVRLSEFAKGKVDSRPASNAGDILRLLNADQLAVVMGWIEGKA